ncbi:MAG: Nif3-like dinuclear metal center hexameric protein [Bacteroidales bacterium]|nr:Nif3-like dinuclear metal center hexameric protein [Bacteroidales bacterium]MDZ4204512.1 Nif3-like dinuclear metal center hexameric protein [Bacteroidales bacterium]
MKAHEVVDYLESQYPTTYQENYDNTGLLIGNLEARINALLVCLDVTEEIIEEALAKNCQMIISHHPLIFNGLRKLTGRSMVERIVEKAIRYQLCIYAMHTNLDNLFPGVNGIICEKFGIVELRVLKPKENLLRKIVTFCPHDQADAVRKAMFDAGAGKIGNYDSCSFNTQGQGTFRPLEDASPFVGAINQLHVEQEVKIEAIYPLHLEQNIIGAMTDAHPYEEVAYDILILGNEDKHAGSGMLGRLLQPTSASGFLSDVKEKLGLQCLKYAGNGSKIIRKVALCGGSGSFLIQEALKAGADIFLTGDLRYHDYFIPDGKMVLADFGHYESEQFTKDLIVQLLIRKFPTFAILKTALNTNPVNFI